MASTYVNDLRLNEMGTGDASGTWGTNTNVNLELIGEALGYGTEAITTNADTHTSTIADGATDPVRAMYVEYTGTLDSACTITIAPNTINRMQFIENGTSGSQNIIISQGSGANITIPPGDVKAVYLDGAGSGAAVVDAFASLNVVDLKVQDDLTVTDDVIIGGDIDLEGSIDVNGTANLDVVDIDGAVNIAAATTIATDNKIQFRDAAIHISSSADGQLDLVADTEIQIAATTIDINGAINASGEIIAASLDISGNVDVDGTLETDALSIASTTVTSSAAELNFSDGVTSNIQTQLDTKATTGKAIAMALVFG
jgi:cytoskeletal protein CcmA (bactofilin family)